MLSSNLAYIVKLLGAVLLFLAADAFDGTAQTVQLRYEGNNGKIKAAITAANRILSNAEFYSRIESIDQFDNSTYSGRQISKEMQRLNRIIEVESYWNPFGFANAKTVSIIRLNAAKLKRDSSSVINTMVHETVHAVDWWTDEEWNYTHEDNNPNGEDNTAPWVIGAIAELMAQ